MKFILTADWHLRRDKPLCRLDEDWIDTQKQHVERVVKIAKERNVDICNVGDVFDTPQQSSEIEQIVPRILEEYDVNMYILPGNHDLRFGSMEYLTRCSIGALMCCRHIYSLQDTDEIHWEHVLVFENEKTMPPNIKAVTAENLLDKYPSKRYIFTGDMHHRFIYNMYNRYVVNPGCLNIQVSNMQNYETGVWYVDTYNNIFEWIPVPDNPEMVTQEHNILKREKSDRISSFIEHIKSEQDKTLDFWKTVNNKLDVLQDVEISNNIQNIKEKIV